MNATVNKTLNYSKKPCLYIYGSLCNDSQAPYTLSVTTGRGHDPWSRPVNMGRDHSYGVSDWLMFMTRRYRQSIEFYGQWIHLIATMTARSSPTSRRSTLRLCHRNDSRGTNIPQRLVLGRYLLIRRSTQRHQLRRYVRLKDILTGLKVVSVDMQSL